MSAPSVMCRTSLLILILAAGLVAHAADAPVSVAHKHAARRRPVAAAHQTRAHVAPRGETARSHARLVRGHAETPLHRRMERRVALRTEAERRRELTAREIRTSEIRFSETGRGEERTAVERPFADRPITERPITEPPVTERPTTERRSEAEDGATSRAEAGAPAADVSDSGPEVADDARVPAADELPETASLHIARGGMPPPMRGSLALLERQDARLEADGLERIEDESDLAARIAHHLLVPLPASAALTVNPELPANHRYCRPWTARFVADIARAHDAVFHRPLEVNSAVRTVAYQEHLERINGNAAPAEGDIWSPHLMGATIDFGKKDMSLEEIAWMRRRLTALEAEGKIDVEEEFEQACFHITVYKSYVPHTGPEHTRPTQDQATDESAAGQ
jgi:hypothetical protein